MKKLIVAILIVFISLPVFAELDSQQLNGKWKYTIVTDQQNMTGVLIFSETDGKLNARVETDEGYTGQFSKVEIKEDKLYLELKTENDLIKVTFKLVENNLEGMASSYEGEAPITAKKLE